MANHESSENYLETILVLSRKKGNVKSIDIVHELGFSKPSVSVAMKNLKNKKLINVDVDGYITLTQEGLDIANRVYERHVLISDLLIELGVSSEVAAEDACKLEHVLSEESFQAIKNYVSNRMKR
jgi:Mn-dependent DtxR family transcriptional regulator